MDEKKVGKERLERQRIAEMEKVFRWIKDTSEHKHRVANILTGMEEQELVK